MSRRDQLKSLSAQIRTPPAAESPAEPAPAVTKPAAAVAIEAPAAASPAKTSLSLPPATAHRLREWSEATGRSLADGIITALIDHGDALTERCRSEARRVRLGLPALTPGDDSAERTTVTVRVPAAALAELDDTARDFGLTRSGLTTALLDLYLP